MERILILCPDYPPTPSALAAHTRYLAEHLRRRGCDVIVLTSARASSLEPEETKEGVRVWRVLREWGWGGIGPLRREIARAAPTWVLVQYVPHLYGRRGINLALPLALLGERVRGRRIVLLVHELYVDFPRAIFWWRHVLLALAQRAMFWMAAFAAEHVAVSTGPWVEHLRQKRLARWGVRARLFLLPVPSNIEPRALPEETDRRRLRRQLGLSEDELVLCFFGTFHVSKQGRWLLQSLRALEERGIAARLLVIGPDSDVALSLAEGSLRERILATGYVEEEVVSLYLRASDMLLLPTTDGVSTRRSSLMAALSHGLPVVGTWGRATDAILRPAMALAPADDLHAFLRHVIALAEDVAARQELGRRGLQLYRDHFCWSVVVDRLLAVLRRSGSAPSEGEGTPDAR